MLFLQEKQGKKRRLFTNATTMVVGAVVWVILTRRPVCCFVITSGVLFLNLYLTLGPDVF